MTVSLEETCRLKGIKKQRKWEGGTEREGREWKKNGGEELREIRQNSRTVLRDATRH